MPQLGVRQAEPTEVDLDQDQDGAGKPPAGASNRIPDVPPGVTLLQRAREVAHLRHARFEAGVVALSESS